MSYKLSIQSWSFKLKAFNSTYYFQNLHFAGLVGYLLQYFLCSSTSRCFPTFRSIWCSLDKPYGTFFSIFLHFHLWRQRVNPKRCEASQEFWWNLATDTTCKCIWISNFSSPIYFSLKSPFGVVNNYAQHLRTLCFVFYDKNISVFIKTWKTKYIFCHNEFHTVLIRFVTELISEVLHH